MEEEKILVQDTARASRSSCGEVKGEKDELRTEDEQKIVLSGGRRCTVRLRKKKV